jgi:hypothetical protein
VVDEVVFEYVVVVVDVGYDFQSSPAPGAARTLAASASKTY